MDSVAAKLVRAGEWRAHLDGLRAAEIAALEHDWGFWSRHAQRAPEGRWRRWLILGGRGFGKTRAGAEWVRGIAEAHNSFRIALVAATMAEARSVMVEGESGLLAIAPPDRRPRYEPSLNRLTWPGGARAQLFSAAEPDSLRGPSHHIAWADEVAKWADGAAAWANLELGLRSGANPRVVATTTPRPTPLVRRLLADAVVTRGTTRDNALILPRAYLDAMEASYAGTRLGRQELLGELVEDNDGAFWTRAGIEAGRMAAVPRVRRVVIGVDPPASAGDTADACGIVTVALGDDGHGYVLDDASVQGRSPEGWAQAVVAAAARSGADRVIAEANNGGAMVEAVLRAADAGLPLTLVHAARGKAARAEPVSLLYARGMVHHVGGFPALEDEMCGMTAGGYRGPGRSPDRLDALVWGLSELMLGKNVAEPGMRLL